MVILELGHIRAQVVFLPNKCLKARTFFVFLLTTSALSEIWNHPIWQKKFTPKLFEVNLYSETLKVDLQPIHFPFLSHDTSHISENYNQLIR